MKKLSLILLTITSPILLWGQDYIDRIITNKNDTIICTIRSVFKKSIDYTYTEEGSRKPGRINKTDVLDYKWNNKPESVVQKEEKQQKVSNLTSGDYLIKAKKNMLLGITISSLGSITSSIIISSASEQAHFQAASMISLGTGVIGMVFNVVGIVQIGKSGKLHNKDVSLYLKPTINGISLCLNF